MENIITQISRETKRLFDAKKNKEAALFLKDIAVVSIGLLGAALSHDDLDSAIACLDFSLSLEPTNWIMYSNKAHCYNRNSDFDKAAEAIEKAIQFSNNTPEVYYNAGIIYSALKNTKKSIEMYKKAIELSPNSATYKFNYGCELLRLGDFDKGWSFYESRMNAFPEVQKIKSRFNVPDWNGSKVDKLFVYNEQGIGDFFQFMRYIPLVKERCNHLTIEVQKEVGELTQFYPQIDKVIYRSNEFYSISEIDAACSCSSFPFIFGAKPGNVPIPPYIDVEAKPLPDFAPESKYFLIGATWAGNPRHPHDIHRSFPLSLFSKISHMPNVRLWNLQKDSNEKRIWNSKEVSLSDANSVKLYDLHMNNNFKDCAVQIKMMDLVITCDTAVAHLAGAMNKPVWLILGHISDFRWGGMDLEESFWYPSMKIFRRKKDEKWEQVFERVEEELESLTTKGGRQD